MNGVDQKDEIVMCAAVLHDLLEDRKDKYTPEVLFEMGFTHPVVNLISIVTHDKDSEDYDTYIKRIAAHGGRARQIKMADLKDNSDITRLKGLGQKDFDRMEKYHRSWVRLDRSNNI